MCSFMFRCFYKRVVSFSVSAGCWCNQFHFNFETLFDVSFSSTAGMLSLSIQTRWYNLEMIVSVKRLIGVLFSQTWCILWIQRSFDNRDYLATLKASNMLSLYSLTQIFSIICLKIVLSCRFFVGIALKGLLNSNTFFNLYILSLIQFL